METRIGKLMKKFIVGIISLALSATWSQAAGLSIIFSSDIAPYRQAFDGFKDSVREGKGVLLNGEHILGKEEGEKIVERIATERPQLVFAVGSEAAKLAKEKLRNIPVVFAMVLNPQHLMEQNVAGVSLEIPVRTKLEKIRRILPDARRIGVIYSQASAAQYRETVQACRALGLQAVGSEVKSGKELPDAFGKIVRQVDLFLMLPDTKVFFPKSIEYLLVEALKNKVPVIGLAASYTRAGALISFEADYREVGRQAGEMALQIIEGAKPVSMEPSKPRTIKSSVNLAVVERLGIRIDPQLIREASDVFR